jgi:solute:Na+ symporter, SSS family
MRLVDLGVILLYLVLITWFGARFGKTQKSLRDYFLGGRTTPWWAIAFSIVSAETSTLTVIGTPALSFWGNLGFLQVVFGYLLARILIVWLFLPHYFRGELFTAYELMDRRFGPRLRKVTAGTFLVLRALAEGVRVFAISIVISIVLGTGEIASIFLIVGLTLFYTFEGGMTAVIWTDVLQMLLYIGGAVLSLGIILGEVHGGWPAVWQAAAPAGKLRIFEFGFSPTAEFFSRPYTFLAGFLGGCFLATASHGTEQLMVQRLLSARNEADSRTALLASWLVIFFQFSLFLIVGVCLWVYYGQNALDAPQPADRIYPEFVWNHLPVGLAGLVIAAILAAAMSNLSAALNSLASTSVMDFYRPIRAGLSEAHYLKVARGSTVLWGGVLLGIGIWARRVHSVLEAGLGVASILYGALLGVFLVGVLTKRVGERAAMAGMTAGVIANLYIRFATQVAWTWYVLIGTLVTVSVSLILSPVFGEDR